ncbi:hypothetical protein FBULB1_3411 [Fusarium bulbicola]|nr:hypothetical protein FBULB1_3411 [Fusarium bulbicola]
MATLVETINILRFEIIPRLSIRDQLHLCQTSKDLHTATVSVLYRDITITHDVEASASPPLGPKQSRWPQGIENSVRDEHFRGTGKLKPLALYPVENEEARQVIEDEIDEMNFSETEKMNKVFKDRDFDIIFIAHHRGMYRSSESCNRPWILSIQGKMAPRAIQELAFTSKQIKQYSECHALRTRQSAKLVRLPATPKRNPSTIILSSKRKNSLTRKFRQSSQRGEQQTRRYKSLLASFICTACCLSHYASSGSLLVKHP